MNSHSEPPEGLGIEASCKSSGRFVFAACLGLLIASSLAAAAFAQSFPSYLNYQGKLADAGGNPLSGAFSFEFKLYNQSSGGTLLFDDATYAGAHDLNISNGVYSVQIGSMTPGGIPADVFFHPEVWLEVSVSGGASLLGAETLSPRERLTTSPFSFLALNAEHLGAGVAIATFTAGGVLQVPYGITAATASFTSTSGFSLTTSSGISVSSGGVYAPFFVGNGSQLTNLPGGETGYFAGAKTFGSSVTIVDSSALDSFSLLITSAPDRSVYHLVISTSGTVAMGGYSAADFPFTLWRNELLVNTGVSTLIRAAYFNNGYLGPQSNAQGSISEMDVLPGQGVAMNGIIGAFGNVDLESNFGAGMGIGSYGAFTQWGTGTVNAALGASGDVDNAGTGTIENAAGLETGGPTTSGGGPIVNAYGVWVGNGSGADNVGIMYGVRVEDLSPYSNKGAAAYPLWLDGASPFVVTSTGSVGIGTANPQTPLDIYGTGSAVLTIHDSNPGGIDLYSSGTQIRHFDGSGAQVMFESVNPNQYSYISATSWQTPLLFFDTLNARVGVLTSHPNAPLEVDGTVLISTASADINNPTPLLDLSNTNAANGWFFRQYPNGNLGLDQSSKGETIMIADTTLYVGIGVGSFSPVRERLEVNGNIRSDFGVIASTLQVSGLSGNDLVVNGSGNVGIGTSSPTSPLQVIGIPVYADNASALTGGLTPGAFYRTGSGHDTVYVVHAASHVSSTGDGSTAQTAGGTCQTILTSYPASGDGAYWIAPDGNTTDAFQDWCDMTNQGGGWTLVVGIDGTTSNHINSAAVTPANLTSPAGKGKLADATINQILGGANSGYRFTCASVTGYFPPACAFGATTNVTGACTAESYVYPPSYSGTEFPQVNIVGLADGDTGTNNRLIYANAPSTIGCDTAATGWGQNGTVYVRGNGQGTPTTPVTSDVAAYLASTQTFTGQNTFTGAVGIGTSSPQAGLDVTAVAGSSAAAIFRNSSGVAVATVTASGIFAGTQQWTFTLYDPTGLTTADNVPAVIANRVSTVTVQEVWCESDDAGAAINLQLDSTATDILSADLTCGLTGSATNALSSANVVNFGDKIDYMMRSVGGGAKRVNVVIRYTIN